MPDINRREFIGNILGNQAPTPNVYDINKDEIFLKYANKVSPLNFKHSRAGLSQYTGIWGDKQKIHLIRRLGFGVTPADINAIGAMTMSQTVDAYLNNIVAPPSPPVNQYENTYADPDLIPLGATWVNAAYGDGTVDYYRTVGVKSWWMNNIINQGQSITEKMILFWHNNFVTQASDVGDARYLYKYLSLLRTHALGNFKTFVKEITKDPQMLQYLNGQYNVKNSPDENYARELQELFTIGKGSNLWNEDDVKEAAKVLTGFRADKTTITTSFYPALHEQGNKVFSAFYNNTVIVGQAGPAGENELDDLLTMIFSKDDYVARFLCRKIYRFFIYYDIDTTIENTIITGMAQTLISNNWEVKPVLSELFKSDHFYDSLTEYCFIRTPMDYFLGMVRTLGIPIPATLSIEDSYQAYYVMSYWSDLCGMDPCDPPNVAGWPAFYQTPHYHEMWINSDTLPKRMKITDSLFTNYGAYVSATFQLKCNEISFIQTLSDPYDPDAIMDDCVKYLLAIGLSTTIKNQFKALLLDATMLNSSWTTAWTNYINNPGSTIYEGIVTTRLQDMLTKLLRMAEHHLC